MPRNRLEINKEAIHLYNHAADYRNQQEAPEKAGWIRAKAIHLYNLIRSISTDRRCFDRRCFLMALTNAIPSPLLEPVPLHIPGKAVPITRHVVGIPVPPCFPGRGLVIPVG